MRPVEFEGCNTLFGGDEVTSGVDCITIPAQRYHHEEEIIPWSGVVKSQDFVIIGVKPSPEDLAAILRGELIFIQFYGVSMPPVFVYTIDREKNQINPE